MNPNVFAVNRSSGAAVNLDATTCSGTAGGTGGDAQGLGVSSMRVGSSSIADSGLNPNVLDTTSGTAGGTGGDAHGLGVSSMRVGSSSLTDSGLNPNVFAVNRSSVAAVNLGSIGTVGGTFGQSSVPPALTMSS